MDPSPLLSSLSMERVGPAGGQQVIPTKPSRHRRVHKEVGAITGITFIDHPKPDFGVVVNALDPEGACAKSGVRVGDWVTKINGEVPRDHVHATQLCDVAWTAEADGTDKNKDRLKFSLHRRTQDFAVGRVILEAPVAVAGATKSVSSLLKKESLDDAGLELEDQAPNGIGCLVTRVTPDSPAHVAGLDTGLTIVSVDGALVAGGVKGCLKQINAARSKKGAAHLVCHMKKDKDDAEHV